MKLSIQYEKVKYTQQTSTTRARVRVHRLGTFGLHIGAMAPGQPGRLALAQHDALAAVTSCLWLASQARSFFGSPVTSAVAQAVRGSSGQAPGPPGTVGPVQLGAVSELAEGSIFRFDPGRPRVQQLPGATDTNPWCQTLPSGTGFEAASASLVRCTTASALSMVPGQWHPGGLGARRSCPARGSHDSSQTQMVPSSA